MGEVGSVEELAGLLCCEVGSSSNVMPLDLLLRPYQVGILLLKGWRRAWQVGRNFICPKGSRHIVIKCTLSSLPTYFLSLFTIPTHIANRLEKFCSVIFVKRNM